jgi:hypothetical protein
MAHGLEEAKSNSSWLHWFSDNSFITIIIIILLAIGLAAVTANILNKPLENPKTKAQEKSNG